MSLAGAILGTAAIAAQGGGSDPFAGLPADGAPFTEDDVSALEVDEASYPFSGLWAGAGGDCSLRPGWDLGSPVRFGPGFYEDFSARCGIVEVTEDAGAYRLFLYCTSGGQGFASSVDVLPQDDSMQAAYYGEEGIRVFDRCPAEESGS